MFQTGHFAPKSFALRLYIAPSSEYCLGNETPGLVTTTFCECASENNFDSFLIERPLRWLIAITIITFQYHPLGENAAIWVESFLAEIIRLVSNFQTRIHTVISWRMHSWCFGLENLLLHYTSLSIYICAWLFLCWNGWAKNNSYQNQKSIAKSRQAGTKKLLLTAIYECVHSKRIMTHSSCLCLSNCLCPCHRWWYKISSSGDAFVAIN